MFSGIQPQFEFLLRIIIAAVLGGLIGLERESSNKPAGLRTNMIVAASAALLVLLGEVIVDYFDEKGHSALINTDPVRIIQAIVVGVSFIGAGTVLQVEKNFKIKFLTTAATILLSTGIGISVALEQYFLAVGLTLFILFINYIIGILEIKMKKKE
jgi:putative Mg2+ transporter-C (MgtC) family protein